MRCPVDGRRLGSVLVDGVDQQRDVQLPDGWQRVCSAECDDQLRRGAGIEIRSTELGPEQPTPDPAPPGPARRNRRTKR